MRAVITVIGKDTVGILAEVSKECAKNKINVIEVTQSVLQDLFAMIMLVDMSQSTIPLAQLSENFNALGEKMNLKILAMHEDIFNSMHKI